jgi:predicted ATPase
MEFHALSGNAFVGREEEIRLLEAELAEASAGRGRLVTLAGDAGIGKTRAVEEFVARAPIPSGRVVWGPCPEQPGAPAYWPWVKIIRQIARTKHRFCRELTERRPPPVDGVQATAQPTPDRRACEAHRPA